MCSKHVVTHGNSRKHYGIARNPQKKVSWGVPWDRMGSHRSPLWPDVATSGHIWLAGHICFLCRRKLGQLYEKTGANSLLCPPEVQTANADDHPGANWDNCLRKQEHTACYILLMSQPRRKLGQLYEKTGVHSLLCLQRVLWTGACRESEVNLKGRRDP